MDFLPTTHFVAGASYLCHEKKKTMKPITLSEFMKRNLVQDIPDDKEDREFLKDDRQVRLEQIMHEFEIATPEAAESLYGHLLPDLDDDGEEDEE